MVIRKIFDFIPLILILFYGFLVETVAFSSTQIDYIVFVTAALLASSIGLFFKRPWSVGIALASGLAGMVTGIVEFFRVSPSGQGAALTYFLMAGSFLGLLSSPVLRRYYSGKGRLPIILIIDDDLGLLKLLRVNFFKAGFFPVGVETGERGLLFARGYLPDLILLDVILPRMKGRTVCSQLKAWKWTKNIPVIFLTAKDSPDDVQAEMAAGGVAHITKPVNYPVLLEEIKKYLPR